MEDEKPSYFVLDFALGCSRGICFSRIFRLSGRTVGRSFGRLLLFSFSTFRVFFLQFFLRRCFPDLLFANAAPVVPPFFYFSIYFLLPYNNERQVLGFICKVCFVVVVLVGTLIVVGILFYD